MSKKAVYLTIFVVVLMGVLSVSINVHKVEAPYPIIFIRADGSIDPPTANVTSLDNVTYTLTANINASIIVERDNIVIDGAGRTLQGAGSGNGITLSEKNNVTIENVNAQTFYLGIYFNSTSHSVIFGSNLTGNNNGIWLLLSDDNIISKNNVANNNNGIVLYRSRNNAISENNVTNNKDHSIYLDMSFVNKIYHNNFIDNGSPFLYFSTNMWDNSYPSGGNYWSDYNGTDLHSGLYRNETGSDGIGDTPYFIDANNQDNYPLMGMFYNFTIFMPPYPSGGFEHVTVISNSTVSNLDLLAWLSSPNKYLQPRQEFIRFDVTGEEGSVGFYRVMIPRVVLNGSYIVLVDWNEVPFTEIPSSNSTHAFLCFTYNHSTQEVIITPEFPSFLILPLFMIATLLVCVFKIFKRQHVYSCSRENWNEA